MGIFIIKSDTYVVGLGVMADKVISGFELKGNLHIGERSPTFITHLTFLKHCVL